RQVSSTESSRLSDLWTLHRDAQNISLKLHQSIVDDRTTINTQSFQGHTAISGHGLQHVARLVAHRFQRRLSDMRNRRATRQANDGATRIGVPVGSAKADEGWNHVNA